MKKISLLLVVLLAAGSAGLYGQMAIGTEFKISGDATATLGYDLNEPTRLGFKNEANANITLELVAKQSADNEGMVGMSGWVGSIELKDFTISINSDEEDSHLRYTAAVADGPGSCDSHVPDDPATEDADESTVEYADGDVIPIECATGNGDASRSKLVVTEPTIVAKLQNGPLWLQIFDAPGNVAGLIDAVENDSDDAYSTGDNAAESNDAEEDVHAEIEPGGQGISLGYTTDDLGVALGVTSDKAYDDADGGWVISADVNVNVGAADLELQVVQGIQVDELGSDDTGVAAKMTTTIGEITLSGGADIILTGDDDVAGTDADESMDFEIGAGADVALTDNTKFSLAFIYSSKQIVGSDLEVVLSDKGGLVESLNLALTWGLYDLANGAVGGNVTENDSMDMYLSADLSYGLNALGGVLSPGAVVTINQIDDGEAVVGLTLKAVLTEAIPAAEMGLQWATDALFDAGETAFDTGTITVYTKITY